MPTLDDELQSTIETFATDLSALVRGAAVEAVAAVLRGGTAAAPIKTVAKRGRGRPRKAAPVTPTVKTRVAAKRPPKVARATKAPVSKRAATPRRPAGQKRPPAELAQLIEKLGDYIKAHPGVRMEALAKALATPSKELRFPARKLITAKTVRTEGQKGATEYFPA